MNKTTTYPRDTVEAYLCDHIASVGPVGFNNCLHYLNDQVGKVEYFELAGLLTKLIREGHVELYDTGDSFVSRQ
jgi:hypothetical protein